MTRSERGTRQALRVLTGNPSTQPLAGEDDFDSGTVVFRLDQLMYEDLDWLLSWCEAAEFPPNLAKLSYRASRLRQALGASRMEAWVPEVDEVHGQDAYAGQIYDDIPF